MMKTWVGMGCGEGGARLQRTSKAGTLSFAVLRGDSTAACGEEVYIQRCVTACWSVSRDNHRSLAKSMVKIA